MPKIWNPNEVEDKVLSKVFPYMAILEHSHRRQKKKVKMTREQGGDRKLSLCIFEATNWIHHAHIDVASFLFPNIVK